ncbi:hypothetical protein [Chishuiella sp.]|uniref:hypothetical protein n=1 Tax=Chishuiella sp. TaxID=1969467 RepID=UPI0028A5ABA1|nr:hypothetical protein [Chishuiella sp.]
MNNSGLIRQLKKLNKNNTSKIDTSKESGNNFANFISIIALLISGISIYFQFFYRNYDLNVSLIDNDIKSDSINLNLIYNNNGNKDATIINSKIYYGKNDSIYNKLNFTQTKNEKPYILSPGNQFYYKLVEKVGFNEYSKEFLNGDTLKLIIKINYLNNNYLQSEIQKEIGWITLDSSLQIDKYQVNYQNINLDSDEYFSSGYNYNKQK